MKRQDHEILCRFSLWREVREWPEAVPGIIRGVADHNTASRANGTQFINAVADELSSDALPLQVWFDADRAERKPAIGIVLGACRRKRHVTGDPAFPFGNKRKSEGTNITQRIDQILLIARAEWHWRKGAACEVMYGGEVARFFGADKCASQWPNRFSIYAATMP
jgi:hypothetical protein